MPKVESTKGVSFEKFLVMSCDGKEVLDSARTLAEATTILADMANQDACFVMKILRTSGEADPVKAFSVGSRPVRYVEQAVAEPPHVETEQEAEKPPPVKKAVEVKPPKKKATKKKAPKQPPKEEVVEEISIEEAVEALEFEEEAPPLEL